MILVGEIQSCGYSIPPWLMDLMDYEVIFGFDFFLVFTKKNIERQPNSCGVGFNTFGKDSKHP